MPLDPVALTRDLCAIPSTTGAEPAALMFIEGVLGGLGLTTERQAVEGARFNLLARTEAPPRVVFSTHVDTVPPYVPVREDATHLYGRGVYDAKGILACEVAAVARLLAAGERRVGLLVTVDEEASSLGARVANGHPMGAAVRFLVNGEPTDGVPAAGTKGSLRVRLRATGHAAHSAYPEAGASAVDALLDALHALRTHPWPTDPLFGETTVNVGLIEGGVAANVLAPRAEAVLQFRLAGPAAEARAAVERLCEGRCAVEVLSATDPLRLHVPPGWDAQVMRYTTDVPYLSAWGTPLLFGPGSILVAHTADERILKADLHAATDAYVRLAHDLLAAGAGGA